MKVYAHYENDGTIRRLVVVDAPDGCGMMLRNNLGLSVAGVEGLELKSASPDELRAIAKTHRVSKPGQKCTVEKK